MRSSIFYTTVSALFSILVSVFVLVVLQARETTGVTAGALFESTVDLGAWLRGQPIDFIGPSHVFKALGVTMGLTASSLALGFVLALVCVLLVQRWPQYPWAHLPGQALSALSFLPAIVIGFLFCLIYARYINPGQTPIGPDSPIPPLGRALISVVFLAVGNGVFQDLRDGISHDLEEVKRESFIFAVVSRGESVTPYYIRAMSVPLLVRLLALMPIFIGASIPFEFIFGLQGAGYLTFSFVSQFLGTSDGTIYPVILLVLSLGAIVTLSFVFSDMLRLQLDPRQREEASHVDS